MDFPELLRPLDHANGPCGEDLSFSSEFDAVQEARRFDDPTLAQGDWVAELKEADWGCVERLSADLLAHRTKDLRLVAWFAEARCKRHGLTGLADGYELMSGLCERFWHELHPLPEQDGSLEARAGVLDWWLAQTTRLLREVPLSSSSKGVFSLLTQEQARRDAGGFERAGSADDGTNGGEQLAAIDGAMRDTPRQLLCDRLREIERLKSAMDGLRTCLDSRMDDSAPSFGAGLDVLDDLSRTLGRYIGPEGETASPESAARGETDTGDASSDAPVLAEGGHGGVFDAQVIHSRAQAIRQLELIATYFRRTEPHSPVAYLADKAARWGRMPLHEWLRNVVKDEVVLCRMEELLGLEGPSVPVVD